MSTTIKSFAELPKPKTTYVGDRLSIELGDYDTGILADVGRCLGVSGGAVSRWCLNKNGINYTLAQKVSFLLGIPVDHLANTGKFDKPKTSAHPFDAEEFAREVLEIAPQLRCKEFMADAVSRARALVKVQPSKQIPQPAPEKAAPRSNAESVRETVRDILDKAEAFRRKNGLEWVIKDDGSLGATRTVVEEF